MASATLTLTPLKAFDQLRLALEAETINRTDEIEALLIALVSRTHLFMLGPPGVAKSMTVNRTLARIHGANLFATELNVYTDDQDLNGRMSIAAFREDRDERRTAGMLPEAHVAFLDEFWNANSATLRALHSILNERTLRVGDHIINVPLSTLVAASNQLPDAEHDQGAAAYDRLHLRVESAGVVDPDDLRRLFCLEIEDDPAPLLSLDQMLEAQAEAAALPVTDDAVAAVIEITVRLRSHGISYSPRRFRHTKLVARGAAWLAGADEVRPEHLEVLRHMLWDTPAQRGIVERTVLEIASPFQREILDVADSVAQLSEMLDDGFRLDNADPSRSKVLLEIRKKTERTMRTALSLEDRASGRAAATLADTMRRMEKLHAGIALELAGVTGTKSLADTIRKDSLK